MAEDLEQRLRDGLTHFLYDWQVDKAVGEITPLLEALSTSRARSEVLEKALEPFAAIPEYVDANDWSDDADIVARNGNSMLLRFCLGDMRRARAALSLKQKGKGAGRTALREATPEQGERE